jgi:hypothetical protein
MTTCIAASRSSLPLNSQFFSGMEPPTMRGEGRAAGASPLATARTTRRRSTGSVTPCRSPQTMQPARVGGIAAQHADAAFGRAGVGGGEEVREFSPRVQCVLS